ncbi:MAG: EAL domain-containing protein [Gammaproteobacteria bacterium]|nr:EAL domain-containing protein [Gammaproteobacteria bacterium]
MERLKSDGAQAFRKTLAYLESALHGCREAILVVDRGGSIVWLNHALEELLALPHADWAGRPLRDVLALLDEERRTPLEWRCERLGDVDYLSELNRSALALRHDGREFPFELRVEPVSAAAGWVLFLRDVYQSRLLSETVSFQRSHDALTGLLNRAEFERMVQGAVEDCQASGRLHAVAYLDLDKFKVINNTCGHYAGDELLRQITEILREQLWPEDLLARIGGDEFGVVFWDVESETALARAERLLKAVEGELFAWGNKTYSLAVGIGLTVIDAECDSWAAAMREAEIACSHAKEHGGNRVSLFREDDGELARQATEMEWVSTIVQALQNDRFVLYGQAIAPLGNLALDEHLEVLVRMLGPDDRVIPPGAFLPAAERYNLILMLDRWVVSHTLEWMAAAEQRDWQGTCAINLSGASIGHTYFLDFLLSEIRNSRLPPERLCFEVTETVAVSNLSSARAFIGALRDMGCYFALDDFGAGMSSFAYLKNLPVDYLKIDGVFVRDLVRDPIDHAMVRSINDIGHVMSMKTIAEFVEDEATIRSLRAMGVDYGQGYGIAKPISLAEFPLRQRQLAVK